MRSKKALIKPCVLPFILSLLCAALKIVIRHRQCRNIAHGFCKIARHNLAELAGVFQCFFQNHRFCLWPEQISCPGEDTADDDLLGIQHIHYHR